MIRLIYRLAGHLVRLLLAALLLMAGGWTVASASAADVSTHIGAAVRAHHSERSASAYDARGPDIERSKPSETAVYAYDTPGERVDAAGDGGRVERTSSRSAPGFVAPNTAGLVDDVASTGRWAPSSFGGNRVYQRGDLIDPGLADDLGRTNLQRMEGGLAPIGPDGRSLQLHHLTQRQSGAIAEVTATFHQQNSSILHINPSSIPSGIDRAAFNTWRSDYWRWRAGDFG